MNAPEDRFGYSLGHSTMWSHTARASSPKPCTVWGWTLNQCGLFQVALAAVTQGGDQNDRPAHAQAAQTTRQMQTLELKSACCDGAAQLAGYREEYWRLYGELRRSRASLGGLGSRIAMHPALILALKTTRARRSRCGPCSPTRPHA